MKSLGTIPQPALFRQKNLRHSLASPVSRMRKWRQQSKSWHFTKPMNGAQQMNQTLCKKALQNSKIHRPSFLHRSKQPIWSMHRYGQLLKYCTRCASVGARQHLIWTQCTKFLCQQGTMALSQSRQILVASRTK